MSEALRPSFPDDSIPPRGYTAFIASLRDYAHGLPTEPPPEPGEPLEGEHEAVRRSIALSYEAGRAPRFLIALDDKHGHAAVQNFLKRYVDYLKASEENFACGRKAPRLHLLGYEKDLLGEIYAPIGKRERAINRRTMLGCTGALIAMAGYKIDDPDHYHDFVQQVVPKLLMAFGTSGVIAAIVDEWTSGRKEHTESKEALIQFIEGTDEILSHIAAEERRLGRKPPDFLGY